MSYEWEKAILGDVTKELSDGLHKAPNFVLNGEYLFVNATNLEKGNIVEKDKAKRTTYEEYLKYGVPLSDRTILYSIDGTIGNMARYRGEKCVLGKGACYINLKDDVDLDYIYYLLQSPVFNKYINTMATGSTIRHISLQTMRNFRFMLPSLDVQRRSRIFRLLDEKIELNNSIIAELESMAKTIYDYWFVQFDFPNADGKPYRSSCGEMVWNEQLKRKIPKGWTAGLLSDISNITMGQSPNGDSYNENTDGMIFFQGCTDFGHCFPTTRVYTNQPSRIATQGDILLSVRAPVGTINIASEQCCIGRGLAALNSKCDANSYLLCLLQGFKPLFNVINGNGTTFGSLTKDMLYEMPVCIPDNNVVMTFEDKTAVMNEYIYKAEMQIRELTKLRDWLLPMLMNGQVTVE